MLNKDCLVKDFTRHSYHHKFPRNRN